MRTYFTLGERRFRRFAEDFNDPNSRADRVWQRQHERFQMANQGPVYINGVQFFTDEADRLRAEAALIEDKAQNPGKYKRWELLFVKTEMKYEQPQKDREEALVLDNMGKRCESFRPSSPAPQSQQG